MELSQTLQPIKRWWWLIVLSVILAGVTSFLAVREQPDLYSSRTTLIAGSTISSLNPSNAEFQLARQLALLYAEIAMREPVRESTKEALGLTRLPRYEVTVPDNGQLIEILVTDTDPERARVVANELAQQLIQRVPENTDAFDQSRQEFTEEQLDFLEEKIRETEGEITAKQIELADLSSAEQIADTEADMNALQAKLSTLQANYAALLSNSRYQAVNTISVIEPADLPTAPTNASLWLYALLSAGLGLTLSTAAAYLLEYMDDSLKTEEELKELTDLPVIARLPNIPAGGLKQSEEGLLIGDKFSPEYESFRILRTNLVFSGLDYAYKSILVVSPGPEDGKSTIAVNLALAFAHAGKKTVLVDADFRKPDIHRLMDLTDIKGLSDTILSDDDVSSALQKTIESDLWAVSAGKRTPLMRELLSSPKVGQVLEKISSQCETMIVDSPPLLMADASVLASNIDVVLLVVRLHRTTRVALEASLDQLSRARSNVAGIVINDPSSSYSSGYLRDYFAYSQLSPVSESENGKGPISVIRSKVRGFLARRGSPDSSEEAVDL